MIGILNLDVMFNRSYTSVYDRKIYRGFFTQTKPGWLEHIKDYYFIHYSLKCIITLSVQSPTVSHNVYTTLT